MSYKKNAASSQDVPVFSSVFEQELVLLLYQFHYLSIYQIVRLLRKETVINYVREKMKKLVDLGLVETQFLPRVTQAGKTVYAKLKGSQYLPF